MAESLNNANGERVFSIVLDVRHAELQARLCKQFVVDGELQFAQMVFALAEKCWEARASDTVLCMLRCVDHAGAQQAFSERANVFLVEQDHVGPVGATVNCVLSPDLAGLLTRAIVDLQFSGLSALYCAALRELVIVAHETRKGKSLCLAQIRAAIDASWKYRERIQKVLWMADFPLQPSMSDDALRVDAPLRMTPSFSPRIALLFRELRRYFHSESWSEAFLQALRSTIELIERLQQKPRVLRRLAIKIRAREDAQKTMELGETIAVAITLLPAEKWALYRLQQLAEWSAPSVVAQVIELAYYRWKYLRVLGDGRVIELPF